MIEMKNNIVSFANNTVTQKRPVQLSVEHVNIFYGENHAVKDVTIPIHEKSITALIGPSGCGNQLFAHH
ncbi:hypothetical protein NBRC111894_554 [Sporolactobacillus inulinus]|uniref:Phosphate transport ATP-binding protein PstB n=1 Tax=Sporolactobacillus inulinus TaxID=2078 RepID=A0A4Y1Z7K6_9BACL|nr:hypothetical protein NBRC111894_554 [Sporolactobacillus inulinus]